MKTSTALVAAVTVLGTLATLAYLLARGGDVAPVLAVVTPVLSALFVAGKVDGQSQTLAKIDTNTNGVLTSRIRAAVAEALDGVLTSRIRAAVAEALADAHEGGRAEP